MKIFQRLGYLAEKGNCEDPDRRLGSRADAPKSAVLEVRRLGFQISSFKRPLGHQLVWLDSSYYSRSSSYKGGCVYDIYIYSCTLRKRNATAGRNIKIRVRIRGVKKKKKRQEKIEFR